MTSDNVYKHVQEHYGSVARAKNPSSSGAIAQAFGYSEEELHSIPQDANLGLSCGNPLAIAGLREGETVIDLGSGAGFDVFLAAKKLGPEGRAIGVDMNKDMLQRARNNQAQLAGADNVSFVEGKITSIPLEDGIADCIISNCVINLVPEAEKAAVFAEMGRLLKQGGRVAISDILARKPFPAALRESVALYVGCIAGCSMKEEYSGWLKDNGFHDIVIVDAESDLNVYTDMAKDDKGDNKDSAPCCGCGGPAAEETIPAEIKRAGCGSKENKSASSTEQLHGSDYLNLADVDLNEWAGSFKIFAVKT